MDLPKFNVDALVNELELIKSLELDPLLKHVKTRKQLEQGMVTPREASYRSCFSPSAPFYDSWRMDWKSAKVLKKLLPDLDLYWTDGNIDGYMGRIVLASPFSEFILDCDEFIDLINEVNLQTWKGEHAYKIQLKPKRIKLSKHIFEGMYKV